MLSCDCMLLWQDAGELVLRVSSRLPRYSDKYRLMLDSSRNQKVTVSSLWRQCPRYMLITLAHCPGDV